jgi:Mrp family chromosome partitioning ATPase
LSAIIDPDLNRDIVSLGFVKQLEVNRDTGEVRFDLELTTPACPVKDQFVSACETILKRDISWVKSVKVKLTARQGRSKDPKSIVSDGLKRVSNVIAVSSCKGGVGKSSVAYNLATILREKYGAKVGLLDADIYGPSLPVFVPEVVKGAFDESMTQQVQVFENPKNGIKLMSMGYLKPKESVALRGPMVSGIIQQLLTSTGWGQLDYLVIDMPPGTGDIHLTIGQHAPIDGTVVVTTPQELAIVDVEKGLELFNKLNIPSLAMVENFSFFKCTNCDERHEIFGSSGAAKKIALKYGIENVFKLPIDKDLKSSDSRQLFERLAETVVREISKKKFNEVVTSVVVEDGFVLVKDVDKEGIVVSEIRIPARVVRLNCKSATMIDEWTGQKLFKDEDIPTDVTPRKIESAGNYAVRIDWSDGHHSIYPIKALKEMNA